MAVVIKEIRFDDVVEKIEDGNAAIIGIHLPYAKAVLHWLFAYGYNRRGPETALAIADPLGEIPSLSEGQFESLVDTYMGRRIITVNKNKGA